MNYFKDLFGRLCQSRRWIAAQLIGTPLLILVAIAWTRLPEKHLWQVALSLFLPVLVTISALELNAGTMRSLLGGGEKRVKLVWGAATLLLWIAVVWICWAFLDLCDDRFYQWAGYLNSQAPAHLRARIFTYDHLVHWMNILEWIFRWIIVPAKVIPYAMASSQSGLRLPLRRVLQLLWNWRWWPAVVVTALLGVWLPGKFFEAAPHGTLYAQIARVSLKLAAAYLLAMISWLLLLAWAGVLFARQKPWAEDYVIFKLLERLRAGRRWIWAQLGWVLLIALVNLISTGLLADQPWRDWVFGPLVVTLMVLWLILQAGMLRSLLDDGGKRVRLVWGTLALLMWAVVGLGIAFGLSLWHTPIAPEVIGWVVTPAILLPFAAASAVWGMRLPWQKLQRLSLEWQWWLGVVVAALLGVALPALINAATQSENTTPSSLANALRVFAISLLSTDSLVLLLGWLAALLDRNRPQSDEALAVVLGQTQPPEIKKEEPAGPSSVESR